LASYLNHVNIVQIFELGRVASEYFISMEYIDGRDIRRILRHARKVSGPPPIHVTVGLLLQLCDALEYAHSRVDEHGEPLGLVHRDVSPSNLLVTKSGHLKVIDFGIAKAQSQQLRTQTGRVKGKLAYMAPEAISGKELDCRSDIFSAGVIAHELLTARPLFASKNEYQTLINVQRSDILSPSAFNQAVPPELDAIVHKALSRDPDERYHHAAQMRDDLHGVRIRYNLSATNREVQTWSEWAFSLEAPGGNFSGPAVTDSFGAASRSPIKTPLPLRAPSESNTPVPQMQPPQGSGAVRARAPSHPGNLAARAAAAGSTPAHSAHHDEEDADVAWGGGDPHESGQPVLLDDVRDHSGSHSITGGHTPSQVTPAHGPGAPSRNPPGRVGPGAPTLMANAATDSGTFSAHDPASASTMVGLGAPPQRANPPSSWPHGSSNDAVAPRRTTRGMGTAQPVADAPSGPALGDVTTPNPLQDDGPAFGAHFTAQRSKSSSKLVIIGAIAALVIGGGLFIAFGRGGGKSNGKAAAAAPAVDPNQPATLKFIVEPTDAIIKIAGMAPHTGDGTPWVVPLDPGVVQIKVSREGHQSWETSVELTSGQTKTVRVSLGAAEGDANMATLSLVSDPDGLTVLLDGQELNQKTPVKMPVPPGMHSVVVRQNGEVMWRHSFQAEASTLYEFKPSMAEIRAKQERERVAATTPSVQHERAVVRPPVNREPPPGPGTVTPPPGPGSSAITPPPLGAGSGINPGSGSPPAGSGSATTPPAGSGSAKITTPPAGGSGVTTPPAGSGSAKITTPPAGTGSASGSAAIAKPQITKPNTAIAPVVVPPNAVKRTSGELPKLSTILRPGQEMPKGSISAKICIDAGGAVTNVQVFKLTGEAATSLAAAIKSWRYTTHKIDGKAVPACFVNSFTLK
ncbi:MAG TPA: protein kinase, partial [Kofleriaceae bacterium]|nr:protein kinase [Kofleriaceae bacterium]